MPTGPEAFLEPLGVSRLRALRQDPPKKALYHTRTTYTDFLPAVDPDSFRMDTYT